MRGKIILLLLSITFITACGSETQTTQSEQTKNEQNYNSENESNTKEKEEVKESYIQDETLSYDGIGDDVISLKPRNHSFILYVKGNDASSHFAVKGYDENGNLTELFVNTSEPYEGITIDPNQITITLEITATGNWHIEQRDVTTANELKDNETYSGTGDTVLMYNGNGKTATITGNNGSSHFAVKSYGDSINLMVNTSDPYDGKTMLKYNPFLFEINAEGDWQITIE